VEEKSQSPRKTCRLDQIGSDWGFSILILPSSCAQNEVWNPRPRWPRWVGSSSMCRFIRPGECMAAKQLNLQHGLGTPWVQAMFHIFAANVVASSSTLLWLPRGLSWSMLPATSCNRWVKTVLKGGAREDEASSRGNWLFFSDN
jgi:hypothetical protein